MKLGRNFTNTLIADVLDEDSRKKVISGEIDMFSLNGMGLLKFKNSVIYQLESIKKLGLDWLELDCDIPNPYLSYTDEQCSEILNKSQELEIDISIHLSYSGIGKEISSVQAYERNLVVGLHQKYLDFGQKVGAKACTIHPGTAPFYFLSPVWMKQIESSIIKSLEVLVAYANEKGMKFHLENNVSFDNIYYENEDLIDIVSKLRDKGQEIYYNFDIGHWFTRAEKGKEIPDTFLDEMKKIPAEFVYELHLNDYVPKKIIFHPPLLETPGFLTEDKLKEYFEILKTLKPDVVVLETAFKTKEQVAEGWNLLEAETKYIKGFIE